MPLCGPVTLESLTNELLDLFPGAIFVCDSNGIVNRWNRRAGEIWGREPAQGDCPDRFCGSHKLLRADGSVVSRADSPIAEAFRSGRLQQNVDLIVERADGSRCEVLINADLIRNPSGDLLGAICLMQDVTQQKQQAQIAAALALRQSEERFARFMQCFPGLSWIKDLEGRYVYANQGAEEAFGATAAQLYGKTDHELFPPQTAAQFAENDRAALLTGNNIQKIESLTHPDGTVHHSLVSKFAIPGLDGTPAMVGGMAIDVTQRLQAEDALRAADRRFQAVFNQQFQFMAILAPDGTVLDANETSFRTTGVSREEVIGRLFWETPWWNNLPALQERWQKLISSVAHGGGSIAGESDYALADGTIRHATAVVTGLTDESGRVTSILVEGQDDTGRRKHEAKLRESEEKLRLMADTIPQLAWMAGPDGSTFWYNRRWYEYTGTTPAQMEGWGWQSVHDPAILPAVLAQWQTSIKTGEPFEMVFPLKSASGEYRSFLTRINPLRDSDAKIVYWFGTNTDIHEQKTADRRKDEFLATLAHELRNPLAPLRNCLQILKMPHIDAETVDRSRDVMERQVQQLVRLVDDLLDVSRVMRGKIELRREPVELASVVARAVEMVEPQCSALGHELLIDVPQESLLLDGDPLRLSQVVSNLLTNACKYTEPNGHISLSARRLDDRAVLRIQDDGIGIAPDMLHSIFDLFVQADHSSTRSQGGLGIGLTLVRNLVQMHQGSVEARSAGLGHGSEFIVSLPLSTPVSAEDSNALISVDGLQTESTGRRVIVVDDNRDAAETLAALLRLKGHSVATAHDGHMALELARSWLPELVLLDLGMPGMDGFEVARRIRELPGLERITIAALTGWGQQADRRRTAEAGFDHHLVKPVDVKILEELLAGLARSSLRAP